MKHAWMITGIVGLFSLTAASSAQTCDAFDPDHRNSPVCEEATMDTTQASTGFVTARGRWMPSGVIGTKESIVELTCVRGRVPQLTNSELGFCLMAMAYLPFAGSRNLGVSTNYYRIVSWEGTRVIAEKGIPPCERQELVLDFPSNTTTVTSTISRATDACAKLFKSDSQTEALVLKHYDFELYPSRDLNPFLPAKPK